jgi:hypothetical protein
VRLRIFAGNAGIAPTKNDWSLPGIAVKVETDATGFTMSKPTDCEGCVDLTYTGLHTVRMNILNN